MDVDKMAESVSSMVERIGLPGALVFIGVYLAWSFVKAIGPSVATFLSTLTASLNTHTVDHAKFDGKLDSHHEQTRAAVAAAAADLRLSVDSAKSDMLRAVDASADRIVDIVRPPTRVSRPSVRGATRDDAPTPPSGVRKPLPSVTDETLDSEE